MRNFAVTTLAAPPYPARINRHAAQVDAASTKWALKLGLVTNADTAARLSQANAAGLAARACPDADVTLLGLLTDLFTWLFALDDRCDDDGLGADPVRLSPLVAQLLDVLDLLGEPVAAESIAAGPIGMALHDLCQRVRAHSRPVLLRFVAEVREYLLALLWEATNRRHRRVPTVAEYQQMRRHTSGVRPSFTLTDFAHGAAASADGALVDARHHADPRLSRLDALATDLICWCNDVFSYGKERRVAADGHNLPTVIAGETGRDEEAALADAADRYNAGLRAYARLEAELLSDAEPAVRRLLTARRCWIRGTYDWSLEAVRYR